MCVFFKAKLVNHINCWFMIYCCTWNLCHCICITCASSFAHTGCIGVLEVSVILMLLLLMAGDVELNPGPGKCEYTCFAGSCVNVVLTATHLITVKTQEIHETSLSTDPDSFRSRAIVLDVFRRHYHDLVNVIARDSISVARQRMCHFQVNLLMYTSFLFWWCCLTLYTVCSSDPIASLHNAEGSLGKEKCMCIHTCTSNTMFLFYMCYYSV